MARFTDETAFTLALLLVFAVALQMTADLSRVARMVPLAVIVPMIVLLVIQLLVDLSPASVREDAARERRDVFGIDPIRGKAVKSEEALAEHAPVERELVIILWMGLLLVAIYVVGMLVAIPLYTLLYLRFRARESWTLSLGLSGALFAVSYLLFVSLLSIPLHRGWLGI